MALVTQWLTFWEHPRRATIDRTAPWNGWHWHHAETIRGAIAQGNRRSGGVLSRRHLSDAPAVGRPSEGHPSEQRAVCDHRGILLGTNCVSTGRALCRGSSGCCLRGELCVLAVGSCR